MQHTSHTDSTNNNNVFNNKKRKAKETYNNQHRGAISQYAYLQLGKKTDDNYNVKRAKA